MVGLRSKSAGSGIGAIAALSEFTDAEPVAAGGTSQVYRARQPAMDRVVAVKVLGLTVADPRVRSRFEREVAITGRLSEHPLFVTLYGHGVSAAGYPYLVMPWYDAGSLADVLQRNGPISVPAALAVGVRTAAALAYVHVQGLVHRDVKPGNVLVTSLGESVLADFGGAARERDAQIATSVVSPLHVAPEVVLGGPATASADIWSLSSTLCTALAGLPPFVIAGSAGNLVRDMTRLAAPAPPLTRRDVPDGLRDLLVNGLDPLPERRPAAAEFVDRLHAVQASLGLPMTQIPAWRPASIAPTLPRPAPPPSTSPFSPSSLPAASPDGDATILRRPAPVAHTRSWPATVAMATAGAVAGALTAAGVLFTAREVLPSGSAAETTRPPMVATVVQPDSVPLNTTKSDGPGGPPSR
jgi:serine/threonine-protein kinase PknK